MDNKIIVSAIYRGKRTDNGEWVKGYFRQNIYGYHTPFIESKLNGQHYSIDLSTLGKHTGYKNYFTGDIIKSESDGAIGIICFGEYASLGNPAEKECHVGYYIDWQGEDKDLLRKDFGYWMKRGDNRCIGNVHDNPELLEIE